MTIPWLSNDYLMTIQWLNNDYRSNGYPITITNFWSIFLDVYTKNDCLSPVLHSFLDDLVDNSIANIIANLFDISILMKLPLSPVCGSSPGDRPLSWPCQVLSSLQVYNKYFPNCSAYTLQHCLWIKSENNARLKTSPGYCVAGILQLSVSVR